MMIAFPPEIYIESLKDDISNTKQVQQIRAHAFWASHNTT